MCLLGNPLYVMYLQGLFFLLDQGACRAKMLAAHCLSLVSERAPNMTGQLIVEGWAPSTSCSFPSPAEQEKKIRRAS